MKLVKILNKRVKLIQLPKIVYRINDCDLTRTLKSLEELIINNYSKINYYIFNSNFIQEYYSNLFMRKIDLTWDVIKI